MKSKNLFDSALIDAMSSNPVSHQIDEIFKTVIKEKTKTLSRNLLKTPTLKTVQPADETHQNSLRISDNVEISLMDGDSVSSSTAQSNDEEFNIEMGASDELEEFSMVKNTENINGPAEMEKENQAREKVQGPELELVKMEEEKIEPEQAEILPSPISFEDQLNISQDTNQSGSIELNSADPSSNNLNEDLSELLELSGISQTSDESIILDGDLSGLDEIPALDESGVEQSEAMVSGEEDMDFLLSPGDKSEISSINLMEEIPGETNPFDEKGLDFNSLSQPSSFEDLSEDARRKLEEIDEMLDEDASRSIQKDNFFENNIELSTEESSDKSENEEHFLENKSTEKSRENTYVEKINQPQFKDVSQAYSGEMERLQATISNLRADREELLAKINKAEEDRIFQSRQILSLRAELDEKKIELTIIRKKLNEEISNLKDHNLIVEERKLIFEEKNKLLVQELEKERQKNKIDFKKIKMKEKELEQKFELLKSDAEIQIKNRDHKILELKRRIDALEFDMESVSLQEKKSIESRFELENKLEKAIKTLRGAISALEQDGDRATALNNLKKNIDI